MAAYFIAQITIHDPDGYQGYLEGFMPIFDRPRGPPAYSVIQTRGEVIEGKWPEDGIVLMEFSVA